MDKPLLGQLMDTPINWKSIEIVNEKAKELFCYESTYGGALLRIRINDFPEKQLYTLYLDGYVVADFDDFPTTWRR